MKKLNYLLLGIFGFFLFSGKIIAQQFPMTNHYLFNPYSLSPAFAGSKDKGNLFFNYRQDWLNVDPSPETYRFNTSFYVGNNMYLGAEAFMDEVDILKRFKGGLSYTYRLQMANQQYLHFGLWGNVYQNILNIAEIHGNLDDPLFRNLSEYSKMTYNAGFDLIYINKELYVGFGMPTLLATKDAYLMQSQGNFAFTQEYQFHISNTFRLSPVTQLMPFVVVRRTTNQPTIVDVSATFIFAEKFWLSGLYRNSQLVAIGIGGELFNTMSLNYSYEVGIGGIHFRSGGTHEITLGFRFGKTSQDDINKEASLKKQKNRKYMLHDYQQLYEQKYRRN